MEPNQDTSSIALLGTSQPVPAPLALRAGGLTALLDNGQLRSVCYDDVELVRGISFLVRDPAWGTYEWIVDDLTIEEDASQFRVTFQIAFVQGQARLRCKASITGHSDGSLSFEGRASVDEDLLVNRVGFVVLHPLSGVVGRPMTVEDMDGQQRTIRVPRMILARAPATELRSIGYEIGPFRATLRLSGDAFEIEDQRNWTDASLKTFIRPLSRPHPFRLTAGEVLTQSVTLLVGKSAETKTAARTPGREVETDGRLPRIGLRVAPPNSGSSEFSRQAAIALGPQVVLMRLDLKDTGIKGQLRTCRAITTEARAQVALEIILDGIDLRRELEQVATALRAEGLIPDTVVPCLRAHLQSREPGDRAGSRRYVEIAAACRAAFPGTKVGLGSLTDFAEFNANPPQGGIADFVTHGTSANVHAAEDHAILGTLESLPYLFETVRKLASNAPYHLGPVGIGTRESPYSSDVVDNPLGLRIPGARRDPRQFGLFGAAWTMGYLMRCAAGQVEVVTMADDAGDLGIVTSAGAYAPLFHVLHLAARRAGLPGHLESGPGNLMTWHVGDNNAERWIANLAPRETAVGVARHERCYVLDELSFARARAVTGWLTDGQPRAAADQLALGAYAVARIEHMERSLQ